MTFRRIGDKTRLSALSYAIMHKGEEDVLWLLRNGVVPDFGNGNLHRIIQQRMYSALGYYLHTITEIVGEMRYDDAHQIMNERVRRARLFVKRPSCINISNVVLVRCLSFEIR